MIIHWSGYGHVCIDIGESKEFDVSTNLLIREGDCLYSIKEEYNAISYYLITFDCQIYQIVKLMKFAK